MKRPELLIVGAEHSKHLPPNQVPNLFTSQFLDAQLPLPDSFTQPKSTFCDCLAQPFTCPTSITSVGWRPALSQGKNPD